MKVKFRKNKKVHASRNIFLSVLLGILLLVIVGFLINTNLKINRRRTELVFQTKTLKSEIKTLEEKKQEMKEKISQAASKEYLEEVARNQFGLQLPGEKTFVITEEEENEEKDEKKEEENWWERIKNILNF